MALLVEESARCFRQYGNIMKTPPAPFTPANMPTGLLLVILCLSCASCVHYSTPAERNASFSAYKDVKVGEESLRAHLITRSGILLEAENLNTTSPRHIFRPICHQECVELWNGGGH